MWLNVIGGGKMNRYEKAIELSEEDFKQIIGVQKGTFEAMLMYFVRHMPKSTGDAAGRQSYQWKTNCS